MDKHLALDLIEEANKSGCPLKIACSDLEINFKTFLNWKKGTVDQRKGPLTAPKNKLSDVEKKEIIKVATSKEFMDCSPWIIVSKLADKGRYIASESSFYKVLKEKSMLEHRGKSSKKTKSRSAPLVAHGPNQVYSWDITYLKTTIRGQFLYLYLIMDIFSRRVVGFDVHEIESMELSSDLITKVCKAEGISEEQLTLHSDNGGPMKGATMLATLQKLGVVPSFSRPSVSNDNPYSESLFKTLKYCPKYPDSFESVAEAKRWVIEFTNWYNNTPHSGIKFVTPNQRHNGKDKAILEKRHKVYELAKLKNPERWNGRKTRDWGWINKVKLNCLQKSRDADIKKAS